ncbi:MAG: SAM-dependent methyltransferase [Kiritimatiellae bacterium]|nr:SAM-dependent methyltransferase [Kiritimatiellia bacterium]
MEKFELEPKLKEEIRARVRGEGFMKIVQTVRRNGRVFRISMRPVEIGGARRLQAEMCDDGRVQVKNLDDAAAAGGLDEILSQKGARDLHLMTAQGDLHVRVTRKGHVLVSRSAELSRKAVVQPHDRVKRTPLASFDSAALLKAVGIADGEGRVRASMRGKYDQVNEFLKAVGETVASGSPRRPADAPFTVVDCGCGKAYLTLALYHYLVRSLGLRSVRVVGIDRRADVVASAREAAGRLDVADAVRFVQADLSSASLADVTDAPRVDMVISLHACDTATDEALAKGVEWGARHVLAAPCCQHELQKALAPGCGSGEFSGLLRQPILRERLCDILTDSFRAMIMRIMGFRTQVVEFVDAEATARNVMLRCEQGVRPGQAGPVGEYLALRDYWKVTPWLESRLGGPLAEHLARFG